MKELRHLGILGFTFEGASDLYRRICLRAPQLYGTDCYPEITLHTLPRELYLRDQKERLAWWGENLLRSAQVLERAGAEFIACPSNGAHEAYALIAEHSPLPWLHITREVAQRADSLNYKRVGILGTKFTLESALYSTPLNQLGIELLSPRESSQERMHYILREELNRNIIDPDSARFLISEAEDLKQKGCEAVILGCTELPMVITEENAPLPLLDSVEILAEAACVEVGKC